MTYSVHSDTEHETFNDLDEARDVAYSMAEEFGSAYIVDERTNQVIEHYWPVSDVSTCQNSKSPILLLEFTKKQWHTTKSGSLVANHIKDQIKVEKNLKQ